MQPESPPPGQQPTQWQFVPEQQQPQVYANTAQAIPAVAAAQPPSPSPEAHVSWTASEFIAYQKSGGWYFAIFMALLGIIAVIYLLTRDTISTVVTFIIGVLFIGLASRKPRVLNYQITDKGVKIGEKLYSFTSLKSFAVIDEGTMHSIDLLPLQRFMPAISMYYEPQEEEQIVQTLGFYLPKEDRKQPLIDQLMHRIRF